MYSVHLLHTNLVYDNTIVDKNISSDETDPVFCLYPTSQRISAIINTNLILINITACNELFVRAIRLKITIDINV